MRTQSVGMDAAELRDAVNYAPRNVKAHPNILGHWTRAGYWLCGDCGARLLARGFAGEIAQVEWRSDCPIIGVCAVCAKGGVA